MKKITLLILMFSALLSNAQTLDSVLFIPANPIANDTINAQVFITIGMTNIQISRIEKYENEDTVRLNLYNESCGAGYAVITSYDTLIKLGPLTAGNKTLSFVSCTDTNTVDSSCFINPSLYCLDTLNYSVNIIQSINDKIYPEDIKIFPNPADNFIKINFSNSYKSVSVNLIDIYGRKIKSLNYTDKKEIIIPRGQIHSGIYFLEIEINKNQSFTRKIVIQ